MSMVRMPRTYIQMLVLVGCVVFKHTEINAGFKALNQILE